MFITDPWIILDKLKTVGFFLCDMNGKILRCNAAFGQIIGRDDAIGVSVLDITTVELRYACIMRLQKFQTGDLSHSNTQTQFQRPNGARVWCSTEAVAIESEGVRCGIFTMAYEIPSGEDVSRFMELEARLEKMHELVTAMVAATGRATGIDINVGQSGGASQLNVGQQGGIANGGR